MAWRYRLVWLIVLLGALPTGIAGLQERGGADETGPYDVVENWFKPGDPDWVLYVTGVFAESPDRVFVVSGGETPVLTRRPGEPPPRQPGSFSADLPGARTRHRLIAVNRDGNLIEDWSQWNDLLVFPHKVRINPYDPERHVWVIDNGGNQILKFTNDGKTLVMRLGERGVPGTDERHFNWPADIIFMPDGSFYVADGYRNTRVVKFDRDGRFLFTWGTKGKGPGQFDLVHCVAVDAKERIWVADRANSRIQVFDRDGKYLDQWPVRWPSHLTITQDQFLWVTDGRTNRFAKYDLDGKLITYWGTQGSFAGGLSNPHQTSVDAEGNLYVADLDNHRVQKFTPKRNADPARLVGQEFKFGPREGP